MNIIGYLDDTERGLTYSTQEIVKITGMRQVGRMGFSLDFEMWDDEGKQYVDVGTATVTDEDIRKMPVLS